MEWPVRLNLALYLTLKFICSNERTVPHSNSFFVWLCKTLLKSYLQNCDTVAKSTSIQFSLNFKCRQMFVRNNTSSRRVPNDVNKYRYYMPCIEQKSFIYEKLSQIHSFRRWCCRPDKSWKCSSLHFINNLTWFFSSC